MNKESNSLNSPFIKTIERPTTKNKNKDPKITKSPNQEHATNCKKIRKKSNIVISQETGRFIFRTDFEFHSGFAQKCDFYDFQLFFHFSSPIPQFRSPLLIDLIWALGASRQPLAGRRRARLRRVARLRF